MRGDIVLNRAAMAYVAFEGRREVTKEDVQRVAPLVLNHRMRTDPLDPIDGGTKVGGGGGGGGANVLVWGLRGGGGAGGAQSLHAAGPS